jgi:UPF0716 protein FxsA
VVGAEPPLPGVALRSTIDDCGRRANKVDGIRPMSLVKWGFVGLLLLPAAELGVFFLMTALIGWLWTIALFLGTSVIGILLLRRSGRADFARLRAAIDQEGLRAIHLDAPGLASLLGGILLVFPGFITDILGALLLLPPLRRWASAAIGRARRSRRREERSAAGIIDLEPDHWHQIADDPPAEARKRRRRR